MMCADCQRVNFLPTQQRLRCYDSGYQPSEHTFSAVSNAVIVNQPMPHQCLTSPIRLSQQPLLKTFPPEYHPLNIPMNKVSFTYVHLMTVDQTSNWILTLGAFKGWEEAPTYAENFRKKNINGLMLRRLNHELLKFELGVLDSTHRIEMIMTVRQLFPSYTWIIPPVIPTSPSTIPVMLQTDTKLDIQVKPIPSVPPLVLRASHAPKAQAKECEPFVDYRLREQNDSVQMDISPRHFCVKWDSEFSTRSYVKSSSKVTLPSSAAVLVDINDSNLLQPPMARTRRSFGEPKCTSEGISEYEKNWAKIGNKSRRSYTDLVKVGATASTTCSSTSSERSCVIDLSKAALPNDSPNTLLLTLPSGQVVRTGNILTNFLKHKFFVRVQPIKMRSCWLIIFESVEEAKRALSLRRQLGYNLELYRTDESRKRPTPRNPIEYRVLSKVTIRSGKSLHGEIVGELYKNKIVTINKIKGRRARIIRNGSATDPITVGWVSSHTVDGLPLLEQIDDSKNQNV